MAKALVFQIDGTVVRLTSEVAWRDAVARNDLTPDSAVVVEVDGVEVYAGPAKDAGRWTGLFLDPTEPTFPDSVQADGTGDEPDALDSSSAADTEPVVPVFDGPLRSATSAPAPEPQFDHSQDHQPSLATTRTIRESKPRIDRIVAIGGVALLAIALLVWAAGPGGAPADPTSFTADTASEPEVTAPDEVPMRVTLASGQFHDWSADQALNETFLIDGLTISLGSRMTDDGPAPFIRVTDPEGASHEAVGVVGFSTAAARFGVARLDAGSDTPQVIFLTYSGGAHCCTQVQVLNRVEGTWRTLDLKSWDGDGMAFPADHGGGAAPELKFIDNRFLYAFASYAGSHAPPLLFRLDRGRAHDVSSQTAYQPVFLAYMAKTHDSCRQGENAACAAYVAAAARAGRLNEAWAVMLESYDPRDDWPLPLACRTSSDEPCAESDMVTSPTYPEALQAFLGAAGYMTPPYFEPEDPQGRPSFSCARARSDVLALICSSPDLAAADRQMAVEYARAMAFSLDREALQREQQTFIRERDRLSAEPKLVALFYDQRIRHLAACRLTRTGCGFGGSAESTLMDSRGR